MRSTLLTIFMLGSFLSLSAQTLKVHTDNKGRCGYVDQQGNIVVPCKYEIAFPFNNGVGKVGKGDKYGLVDASGKTILAVKYDEIIQWSDNVYRIKSGKNYGLVSNKGTLLAKPKYSFISRPNCYGKALITASGKEKKGTLSKTKVGMVNTDGKIVIEPKKYTELCEFTLANGLPEKSAKSGISLSDTLKTACEYVSCFAGKKNIVIDGNGNAVTPLTNKATYLIPTSGMCGFVIRNGSKTTSGYWNISSKKNMIISNKENRFKALSCTPFTGNIAKIDNPATRTSYFIDKSGKKISDEYTQTKHKDGYWIVYGKDKSCALLSDDGKFVYDKGKYQDFKFPDIKGSGAALFPAKQETKWGLVDNSGNIVIPFEYDDLDSPVFSWLWAVKDNKHGIIDVKGKNIVPFDYVDIVKCDSKAPNNVWVCKEDKSYYNFNISNQRTVGEGMKLATNFRNGLAWVVPQDQKIEESTIYSGLKELYNIKVTSKIPTSFGILVDTKGNRISHIPVPQAMFPIMSEAVAENGGQLTYSQEKRLLLTHTRTVRIYALSSTIENGEWDY